MRAALINLTLCAALPLASWSQSKPLAPPPELPAELSQAEVSKGMARIKSRIDACAAKSQHQGTVTVSVKVMGSGAVDEVKVKSSPAPGLAVCVVAAVQKATFARTLKGGTVTHSFRFCPSPRPSPKGEGEHRPNEKGPVRARGVAFAPRSRG